MFETGNDFSHQSSFLTFTLAVSLNILNFIETTTFRVFASGSNMGMVARSTEERRTQDVCWRPPFRLHLTPSTVYLQAKKTKKRQHKGKVQPSAASSLTSLFELSRWFHDTGKQKAL